MKGFLKGEKCNRNNCDGIIDKHEKEGGCSCHINPPCSHCTDSSEYCPVCDWSGREEQQAYEPVTNNGYESYKRLMYERDEWKKRLQAKMRGELPIDKIEYDILSHTHFTQICEGVYPEGTTMEDVLKKVNGSFGGRFQHFDDGKFKFIAYTD